MEFKLPTRVAEVGALRLRAIQIALRPVSFLLGTSIGVSRLLRFPFVGSASSRRAGGCNYRIGLFSIFSLTIDPTSQLD
jgi:hypothetical protein